VLFGLGTVLVGMVLGSAAGHVLLGWLVREAVGWLREQMALKDEGSYSIINGTVNGCCILAQPNNNQWDQIMS
jgi:hypothetical protein